MTFAAPLFLLAAAAALIPVVLHMIHRRQAKRLPFATLRFLKTSAQKTRRRKRVQDVLLMVLRALVLLLVAAGLAKPTLKALGALGGSSHTVAVIILDNSASMGIVDQDRARLETATEAASQILAELGEGDQVALLPTCGPEFPASASLARTQDAARQTLGQCRVSYERADLTVKLQQARDLLEKSDAPNKQIFVLTDMQRASWEVGEAPPPTGDREEQAGKASETTVIVVDCNRAPKANAAVQGVEIEATVPMVGLPAKAILTLINTANVAQQRRVELLIDGVKEAVSGDVSLPPEGRASQEFIFTFKTGGLHRGEVRLVGEDGSKYDDRRFFAVQIDQAIPIAVVRTERKGLPYLDDAYYLQQALASGSNGGSASRVTTLAPEDLGQAPLEKYKVLFCVNLPALATEAAQRLADYVTRGGNLVWICGDNVEPQAYNRMNVEGRKQLLPAPLVNVRTVGRQEKRDSWHISFLDKEHRAFRGLVEPASLYESVLVYEHVRMAVDGAQATVLARLDDGDPLWVEKRFGDGRVLMFGASMQTTGSNLPLRPLFLPLITQLTLDLAAVGRGRMNVTAGHPIVVEYPHDTQPLGVEIVPPSGETLRLKTVPNAKGSGQVFRFGDTHEIGVYSMRWLDATTGRQAVCVNFDADEADFAAIDRHELQKLLGGTVVFTENPHDLSTTFALLREGKSLWSAFLAVVLAGLILETYVSNRFTPRQAMSSTATVRELR